MAAAWEDLAKELKGKINVAKLDATSNSITAKRFKIQGFPTLYYLSKVRTPGARGSGSPVSLLACLCSSVSFPVIEAYARFAPLSSAFKDSCRQLVQEQDGSGERSRWWSQASTALHAQPFRSGCLLRSGVPVRALQILPLRPDLHTPVERKAVPNLMEDTV